MNLSCDIAVIGSGFAGSLMAMIASRLGRSVVLIESGRHPRFAIGESSTPLANLLLEDLAARYDLRAIAPLAKWGGWQDDYPTIACGLKRGFSFFHHSVGERLKASKDRENQLLVAASPHDRIADVHWFRSDLDAFLVEEAQRNGVEFFDEVELSQAIESPDRIELEGMRHGRSFAVKAGFVVDATGPKSFLHKALQLAEAELPAFPKTQALYTHFTGVRRFADVLDLGAEEPPYPIDDAAVHHVFDGGWIWVLRFNNGLTSAGVAALDHVGKRLRFEEGAFAWKRLLGELPSVGDQFASAEPVRPFVHVPKLAFKSGVIARARWALLPSAAGFIDPLLSTGFPLTLLGIARLASIFETAWGSNLSGLLRSYAKQTDDEFIAASRLIAGLYANMNDFSLFSDVSMLYFAAASFSETARRLGKPELAASFLLQDHPVFGPISREWLDQVTTRSTQAPRRTVHEVIEPINIAGLANDKRRNWYPVDAEDLLSRASRVQSSREEINSLLDRSGFWENRA